MDVSIFLLEVSVFKKIILFAFILILNVNGYAQSIDIQCEYNLVHPLLGQPNSSNWEPINDFNNHKDENKLTTAILEVLKHPLTFECYQYLWRCFCNRGSKNVIYLSVNLNKKDATGGLLETNEGLTFSPAIADIYPDYITVKEQIESAEKHTHLRNLFNINRIDGQFFGDHYEVDLKTNKDVKKYSMYGKCKPIKRLF